MIPLGICVDLETTIAGKIHDSVRPKGQKRFETRIIEIGAVHWKTPTLQWGCLVNPIASTTVMNEPSDLFKVLRAMHQKPDATINFWSRVLLKRDSLNAAMFLHREPPEVWINRTVQNRAADFVRWHNSTVGPEWLTEKAALTGLLEFTSQTGANTWLAHNGKSFDFKVLEGCGLRNGIRIPPSIRQTDTLKLFRKLLPGHKSYSQPKLYADIFKRAYNAHVAIDDARALGELCAMTADRATTTVGATTAVGATTTAPTARLPMDLTFPSTSKPNKRTPPPPRTGPKMALSTVDERLDSLHGIGKKSVSVLATVNITTVSQLKAGYLKGGGQWLKEILPFGVHWRKVATSLLKAL